MLKKLLALSDQGACKLRHGIVATTIGHLGVGQNLHKKVDDEDLQTVVFGMFEEASNVFEGSGKVYDNPYFNWKKAEWDAAPDEEKSQCCLAIVQYLYGFTDDQMATVDLNDANIQSSIQQIKEGAESAPIHVRKHAEEKRNSVSHFP